MAGPFKMKGSGFYGKGNQSMAKMYEETPVKNRRDPKPGNSANLHNASLGNTYQHALAHGKSKAEASSADIASKKKNSPLDHTTNRLGHEKNYGKGHENSAHPNYWKKKKSKDGKEGKTPKKIEIEKSDYMKKAFPHMSPRT